MEGLGGRFGNLKLENSGAGLVDLDLRNSHNLEIEFNQSNSQKSRAVFNNSNSEDSEAEFDTLNLTSRAEFNNSNLQDLKNLDLKSRVGFTNLKQTFNNRNQIGFIDGNNQDLQPNCLTNDLNNLSDLDDDLNCLDYKEKDMCIFPTPVNNANKYVARTGFEPVISTLRGWRPNRID